MIKYYRSVYSSCAWTTMVVFCLLMPRAESAALQGESFGNAIALLTAYSGERAKQYAPFFKFSEESRIVKIDIHTVAMESTTARYSGQDDPWKEVNNILRIRTADGFEGVSGVDSYYRDEFSDELLQELQDVVADLPGLRSLDPVEVGAMLETMRPVLSNEARSSIDIALWDLAARKAGCPLHEMLGAKRDSIKPYASLPFYETLPEYVDAVNLYANLGYVTFKFHVWGQLDQDIALVDLIQKKFAGSDYEFMIDLEAAYDFEDAVTLGNKMDEGLFIWLEGPVDDKLLPQYSMLRDRLDVKIIPAGYNIYSTEFIRQGIETGAWDAARVDATVIGGISKVLELLIITNDADLPIEIQSWGHSLTQAANLHLMLSNEKTEYFEAPMPGEAFEFGMKNGHLFHNGQVTAPKGPGLGIEVDWDRLVEADFYANSK